MTSFAESMKREIARVARKETKGEISALRKASAAHRSDIAALKKLVKAQDTLLRQIVRLVNRANDANSAAPNQPTQRPTRAQRATAGKFDHQAFVAHRRRLGLTQAQMAKLVGVSSLSIYKWETGSVQPRQAQRQSIQEALKLGKRQALAIAKG
jgi:DNA-binding XRE family transcriptional regulator